MPEYFSVEDRNTLVQALNHLRSAITLLDQTKAPSHVAAHIDLAAHQLVAFTEWADAHPLGTIDQIDTNADPH